MTTALQLLSSGRRQALDREIVPETIRRADALENSRDLLPDPEMVAASVRGGSRHAPERVTVDR